MDTCPYCGTEDYADIGPGTPRICLTCGYDDEHGTLGVCPGGFHPRDGSGPACRSCLARLPRDLPGYPRWRSQRRTLAALARRTGSTYGLDALDAVVTGAVQERPGAGAQALP